MGDRDFIEPKQPVTPYLGCREIPRHYAQPGLRQLLPFRRGPPRGAGDEKVLDGGKDTAIFAAQLRSQAQRHHLLGRGVATHGIQQIHQRIPPLREHGIHILPKLL